MTDAGNLDDEQQSAPTIPASLQKAQRLANLLDSSVTLPVINYRVGLDGIIGLIPVVGDVVTAGIALRIILYAKQMGMPERLIKKMFRNTALDFLLGLIPIIGSIADFFYKSNRRNVKLMEMWWLHSNEQALKKQVDQSLEQWTSQHFIE